MRKILLYALLSLLLNGCVSKKLVAQGKLYNATSIDKVTYFEEDSIEIDTIDVIKDHEKLQVFIAEDRIIIFDTIELHIFFENDDLNEMLDEEDTWINSDTEDDDEFTLKLTYSEELAEYALCIINKTTCEGYLYFLEETSNNSKNKTNEKLPVAVLSRMENISEGDESLLAKTKDVKL